jgi:hypothetical protein
VSGRLKVAPEHTAPETLKIMRKPSFEHFKEFTKTYNKIDEKFGLNQQLIPYFISSHPGCDQGDMANLAAETKELGFQLEQVQDFTPTPMTVSTVMYYSGYHPYTMKEYTTPKTKQEKQDQHRYFFWYKPENKDWVRKQLTKAQRPDLLERLLTSNKQKVQEAKSPKKGDSNNQQTAKKAKGADSSTAEFNPKSKSQRVGKSRPESTMKNKFNRGKKKSF